jgi:hypothetical protein
LVWAEELPSAFFQGGDETILCKELPSHMNEAQRNLRRKKEFKDY